MFNTNMNMSAMYGNMFDMWSSCGYKMTKDLDVCMNPYGKDAYGNYRVGGDANRKRNKPIYRDKDELLCPDPIYKVGDVNMWCLENNEIVVGRIVKVYPARDVVSGEPINRYAINVLTDGVCSNNEIYVTEDMVIESLDADTYSNTPKIGEPHYFNPLNTTASDKPNNTDFKCDIDDLKMDINDSRTDIKSLLENQYKIEGDLMVAKQPELGLAIDDAVTSDIRNIKESGERLDCTVNYCVDELGVIREELNEVDNKTKQASKLAKLSFLSKLMI